MSFHEHCRNCFASRCTNTNECPIVSCEFKCGLDMHSCKISDHRHVCQSQRIPCINSHYGCPAKVLRSRLSSHLAKCPANVIICTMEWGRYPVYSEERLRWVPFVQRNPLLAKGCLDVELAIRDQRVINDIRTKKYKHGLSKMQLERFDPKSRKSYERAINIQQEILDHRGGTLADTLDIFEPVKWYNSDNKTHENGEPQKGIDDVECTSIKGSVPDCPHLVEVYSGLGVNINLETSPKLLRDRLMYRVPCHQLLHRSEFAAHFRNVHNDIHAGFGWMEQRCPFAQYGCSFVRYRLRPSTQEGSVVFSQDLGNFGIKPSKDSGGNTQVSYLLLLPSELFEVICEWLDDFSLCNLALTCKTMHQNVLSLLPKRGIVVVSWRKRIYEDGSASWTTNKKYWRLTSAFTEVRHWVHSETPVMSSHLEKCPFYHQHVPEKRFRYVAENFSDKLLVSN